MKTNNSLTKFEFAGSAHRRARSNVAITLRVMSLSRLTHERFPKPSHPSAERLITRERDGYVERLITRERNGYVARAGTTLAEVLMSLMIMSIGIVAAATLFPVSALRTLDANKATNSTIARHVADALTDIDPQFVHDPDGTSPNLGPGSPAQTPYNGTSYLGPTFQTFQGVTSYIVDPLGWQIINQDTPMGAPTGTPVPFTNRDYFGYSPPASVTLSMPRRYTGASLFPNEDTNGNYVLDAGEDANSNGILDTPYPPFGVTAADIAARVRAVTRAFQIVTQPDNWKLVTEAQAIASTPAAGVTSVTLDTDADLSSVPATPTVDVVYRAVIFDVDGIHSEIRYLTGTTVTISPPTLAWTSPLPKRFDGGNIGKVRIEVADEIYTWMLSVRKRLNGSTNVDVVVFFKRAITEPQEQVYDAVFQPNLDNRVIVNFTITTEPVLKRGGYIFDTANGLWYRIAKIENETSTSADLLLDETIKQRNYSDTNSNGVWDAGETLGGAILHPQVANVFPLQHKEP